VNAAFLWNLDEASRWLSYAQASLEILGDVPGLRYHRTATRARIASAQEDPKRAEALYREAIAQAEVANGARSLAVGDLHVELGIVFGNRDMSREAMESFEHAQQIFEEVLSPEHPYVARTMMNRGAEHLARGRFVEAEQLLQRASEIFSKSSSTHHLGLAFAHHHRARMRLAMGHHAQAIDELDRALDVIRSAAGLGFSLYADVLSQKAQGLMLQERFAEALDLYRQAYERQEAIHGANDPRLGPFLLGMADAEVMLGKTAEAQMHLERASAFRRAPPDQPDEPGPWASLVRASLLWQAPDQRPQAVRLAEQARAQTEHEPDAPERMIMSQRIERWLATHRLD
jgi:tetratricopeptide (TPR) repeat protein